MLQEYGEIVNEIKGVNPRFAKIFEAHSSLNDEINNIASGRDHLGDLDLEKLKKEKLRLKDEAQTIIFEYKKNK